MSIQDLKTILLVEDQVGTVKVVTTQLQRFGYAVLVVTTGEQAVQLISSGKKVDLVLMDILLGKGIDCPEAARQILEKRNLPIVFLTSHSEKKYVDRVKQITRYGYVIKNSGDFVLQSSIEMAFELFETNELLNRELTERKTAEEAIRLSYQTLESIGEFVTVTDLDDHFTYVNQGFLSAYGYTRDEVIGKTPAILWSGNNPNGLLESILDVSKTGSWHGEVLNRTKEGREFLIALTTSHVKNDDGNIIGLVGISHDITERKRAEDVLRKSEKDYRQLFENATDVIIIFEPEHEIIFEANAAACAIYGYTHDELVGMSLKSFTKNVPAGEAQVKDTVESGSFRNFETIQFNKNGREIFFQINATLVEYRGRKAILSINRDVTEQRKTEERLRENKNQLHRIFENMTDGVIVIDSQGRFALCNKATLLILNVTEEQFIGRKATDPEWKSFREDGTNYPFDDQPGIVALRTGKKAHGIIHLQLPETGDKWIDVNATPYNRNGLSTDEDPTQRNVLVTFTDITKRKLAEENLRRIEGRLRQSEKMEAIGQLAGGIAHDFNNVLGGIIGYTDMSLSYADKGSLLRNNLLQVLKASERAKNLVKQILAFSRQGNPQKSLVGIQPIVTEVLGLLKSSIPSSVTIQSDLQMDVQPVLADTTQIHQALLNIATNAVYAMSRKGTLTVRLYGMTLDGMEHGQGGEILPGAYTVVEITDTGCGMDAKTLAKAFEPFFTTKPVGEGTGMGLSVVLGIVQAHGGDLKVESEVGKGTTIRIFLPAVEVSAAEAPADHMQSTLIGTERILFVDDEEVLVDMNLSLLTSLGYTVTATTKSGDALQVIREKIVDIDVLITDQTMPGITGIELAKEALLMRKDLPVILCTGFSNDVDRESAMALGISKFIMKPYRSHEISKAIRDVLDAKKMEA